MWCAYSSRPPYAQGRLFCRAHGRGNRITAGRRLRDYRGTAAGIRPLYRDGAADTRGLVRLLAPFNFRPDYGHFHCRFCHGKVSSSSQRIDGSQEFIGQGLANIVGSFFSSYASSGSFTRSGLNYDAGAVTPLSAVFAAIALAIIVLLVAPLAAHLPIAAMAGILLLVAYRLIDFRHIKTILRSSKSEAVVLLVTFFSTLFIELEFAIYVGVMTYW